MSSKYFIWALVLFLSSVAVFIIGTLFKILHWEFGSLLLKLGGFLQVLSIAWAIMLLIRYKLKK